MIAVAKDEPDTNADGVKALLASDFGAAQTHNITYRSPYALISRKGAATPLFEDVRGFESPEPVEGNVTLRAPGVRIHSVRIFGVGAFLPSPPLALLLLGWFVSPSMWSLLVLMFAQRIPPPLQ